MVRLALGLAAVFVASGCRVDFKEQPDAEPTADGAASDGADLDSPVGTLLPSLFYIDAADVDGNNTPGASACPTPITQWKDLATNTDATLAGFPDPPCGAAGGGWAGDGSQQDPYRLRFDSTAGQAVPFGAIGEAAIYTVTAWVRWSGIGVGGASGGGAFRLIPIVAKGTAEVDQAPLDVNYWLGLSPGTGRVGTDFEDEAENGSHPIEGVGTVAADTWVHLAVVYDQVRQVLYINASVDLAVAESDMPSVAFDSFLTIGANYESDGTAGGGYFDGDIAVVRIFSRALSAAEISAECEAFVNRFDGAVCL